MKRIKKGDVFFIPGIDGLGCLSQVIKMDIVFYLKVYSPLFREDAVDLGDFNSNLPIFLIAETTDGEYKRGVWRLLGNLNVEDSFFPYHVVDNGVMVLRNFDDEVIREASEDDVAKYGCRHSVSSPVLTTAVRRRCKEGPDVDYFDIDARRVQSKSTL